MKKILLILCALVCGTLAFAQTDGTYTGTLHVSVEGSESDTKDSQITVEWDTDNTSQLDFTLHDFAISIGSLSLDLGDITVKEVDVEEGTDGEATISCTDDHDVVLSTSVSWLVSDVAVEMTGTISDDKLYADMTISVQLASLLGGSTYEITATFRSSSDDDLNGDYLIMDADGNYLGGGNEYGTHATTIGKPQFIGFELQGNGTYHLDSHQYNSATDHYLGANLYFDNGTPVDWTVAAVDGGYTIYGNGGYLTSNGFQELATVEETPYVWTLVTMDDVVASMDEATADAPVDVTALIASPELKHNSNSTYYPTWTVTGYDGTGTPSNYAFGGGSAVANCAESYHSTNGFNINQELTLPLAGYYTLNAKGFYRDDNSTTLLLPVLYAGDLTSTFRELDTSAGNMAKAYAEFLEGLHQIDDILIEAKEDGETVTIGFKGEDTSLWNIFGELELLYYGTEEPVLPEGPVHECVAEFDHWTISDNTGGSFQRNTWSTEADPSGMTTPFIEYWVGSGNQLSDATISHTQLTSLEEGIYEVSIFARAFNENSLVDVAEGITFTANKESIDLNKETHATYNHVSAEEYGTYTVYCEVGTEGTLDINFTLEKVNCDWLAFKNLAVTYMGSSLDELPTLTAATGTMNSTIASAQSTALSTYATTPTLDNYNAAYQAVECARVSAEFYAGIAEALSQLDDYLDDAGKKWLNANETITAYNAQTLAYQDMYGVYMGAVKQQTTIGIDLTEAMENTGAWTADQGNGPNAYSTFATETYIDGANATTGDVLYYTVTGLSTDVYYTVSFYVAANLANNATGSSGSDISQAYANDKTIDITVGTLSGSNITSLSDMTLVSITCAADEDGVLEFGITNVAAGGNWFLCAPASLAIAGSVVAVADDSDYEVGDEATVDGTIYSIVGENLFNNGGFNNGVLDWTAGNGYTNDLSILNVTYNTEGGYNNGPFLTLKSSVGAANAATPTQAIAVEAGKTYLFVGYTSGSAPTEANRRYSALFEMSDATTEENHDESGTSYSNTLIELEWGDTGWTQTIGVFTVPAASEEGTYSYVGMRMNWSSGSYDGFQLYEVEEVPSSVIWEMTSAGWGTLILPFAVDADDVPADLTIYTCDGTSTSTDSDGNETTTVTVNAVEGGIAANTPYLVKGNVEVDTEYTFSGTPVEATGTLASGMLTGTFVNMDYDALEEAAGTGTVYLLQNHTDGDGVAFYPVVTTGESSEATLTPYHCYLLVPSGVSPDALRLPGMATAIEAVESDVIANDAIYDLSGRRVSKAVKGVYIQNGKKVLVK